MGSDCISSSSLLIFLFWYFGSGAGMKKILVAKLNYLSSVSKFLQCLNLSCLLKGEAILSYLAP